MFNVHVLYPVGGRFDLDYYMQKHMKLVDERWRQHGLTGWSVTRVGDAPGAGSTYQIITVLTFDSPASFQKAVGASGAEVMGDVPNFTDAKPVMQMGEAMPA